MKASRRDALVLALSYGLAAAMWVGFSDRLLTALGLPLEVERVIAATKGQLFVLGTALALYYFARKHLHRLYASEGRYRRLVEGSPDIIYSLSHKDGGTYYSARVETILGYSPQYLATHPGFWTQSVHLDDRARFEHAREQARLGADVDFEYRIRDKAGDWHWMHERSIGVVGAGVDAVTEGVATDVTARRVAEEHAAALTAELEGRVERRTSQLAAANKELESFAYSVSHDLRAPLRAMNGFAAALKEDYADKLDPQAHLWLGEIINASATMSQLIDGMLELSRITRKELAKSPVHVSEVAERVASDLESVNPGHKVSWHIEPGIVVSGDPVMVNVLMRNLLDNAWKYTSKTRNAEVWVESAIVDGVAGIRVRDNGAGFDPAHSSHLFEPFRRLHRHDEFPGIGIGLATCQRITRRHGGNIVAEGNVDCGASFFFTLGDDNRDDLRVA